MRILVVEDEASARHGLVSIIQQLGIPPEDISTASDGVQGLSKLCSCPTDFAFVDIRMPHKSGLDMIREARKMPLNTCFVLTSAYSEFEYAKEALHLGITDYLIKPIQPEEVKALLSPYIVKKKSEDPKRYYHPLVQQMIKTVDEEYSSSINLTNISDRLHRTPEYLSYLFSRDVGVNFSTYLRQIRIKHALEMMQNGMTRVYDVAHACGFSDTKYFCRVFHEITGQLPSNYLKSLSADA